MNIEHSSQATAHEREERRPHASPPKDAGGNIPTDQPKDDWSRGIEAAARVLEIAIRKGAQIDQIPTTIRRLKTINHTPHSKGKTS